MIQQTIRYVRSADGTQIAYADTGEGLPLVVSSNIWAHLDLTWTQRAGETYRQLILEGMRVVRYDMRGMGMSERDVSDFSIERQIEDLEAVRQRTGLERFALWSVVHSTPAGIAYAAAHPQRITHLILSVPFTDGAEWYRAIPTLGRLESFRDMGDEQWELYTLTHATALAASTTDPDVPGLIKLMRASTSPATLRRFFETLQTQDVTHVLSEVRAPTLVLVPETVDVHRFARAVVAGIADAVMVPLEAPLALGVRDVAPVTRFLFGREPSSPSVPSVAAPSDTAVILYADIADSTALTERLGDAGFRERARTLDGALRGIIRANGGNPIEGKLMGDGVLATFGSAASAIAAALAYEGAAAAVELGLHVGLHAGDVMREDGNVFGGAVNIAARISGLAPPGEVLVSDVVRALARTSAGVGFADRGEHALKGVGDPVRVFAVHRA